MEDRIKALEEEIAYLRKAIEEYMKKEPIEMHYHYHYDYSGMKPMIINDGDQLKDLFGQDPIM